MEFQKERVFTALNADELKIGSKVICANNLGSLKCKVDNDEDIIEIKEILEEDNERRFRTIYKGLWPLVYLVSVPEVKDWIVYLCRRPSNPEDYYLTACRSDMWESIKEYYGAKTKLFEGNEDEVDEWYVTRRHFVNEIAAWEDGKTIQYLHNNEWSDVANGNPLWNIYDTYRVKPEDGCEGCMKYDYCANKDGIRCKSYCTKVEYVPFDTVEGLIEAWDNKYPQNKNRPKGTMPLIWIKNKQKNRVYLITDFLFDKAYDCDVGTEDDNLKLTELFEDFTFLDGSVIGKVRENEK